MYEYRKDEYGVDVSCDMCQAVAPVSKYRDQIQKGEKYWLCEICASTYAGNQLENPNENHHIMAQISFCTNAILDAITGRGP